jgi:hypothetical protein
MTVQLYMQWAAAIAVSAVGLIGIVWLFLKALINLCQEDESEERIPICQHCGYDLKRTDGLRLIDEDDGNGFITPKGAIWMCTRHHIYMYYAAESPEGKPQLIQEV